MSLIPFMFEDVFGPPSVYRPLRSSTWSPFGSGSMYDEIEDMERSLNRLNQMATGGEGVAARIRNRSDKFEVAMDVRGFQPQELKVKVQDRMVTVHGKHEERQDEHGFISREFTRRYVVPEGIKMDHVTSSISPSGVLTICAPKLHAVEGPKEMEVEIQQPEGVKGAPPAVEQ